MDIAVGDFFYHNEYGVGQVARVIEGTNPEIELQFKNRTPLRTTEHLIRRNYFIRLSPDGFLALAYREPEAASKMIAEEPVQVIWQILKDCRDNRAKTYEIKEYLAPYIKDWDNWWKKTQRLLQEDPRIDASRAKFREYSIAGEVQTRSEKAYQSFLDARQRSEGVEELAAKARNALKLSKEDVPLSQDHVEELFNFLKQIIYFEKYGLPFRLGTLFRLQEDDLLPQDEAYDWLVKLLGRDFRLYQMEPYTSRRVIAELLKRQVGEREIGILASGMCSSKEVIDLLLEWAFRKSDPEILTKFVKTALSENLPPFIDENQYQYLKIRLDVCLSLVKGLPDSSLIWMELLLAYKQMSNSLASTSNLDDIRFVLPSFINLGAKLYQHAIFAQSEDRFIESFADPAYPFEYIQAILDAMAKNETSRHLVAPIERMVLSHAELRQDNFLVPLIASKGGNRIDQATELMRMIDEYRSPYLILRGGEMICDFARQAQDAEILELLPYLDQLQRLEGEWSWQTTLESLREKGYLAMFRVPTYTTGYRDEAVIDAAQRLVEFQLQEIHTDLVEQQRQLEKAQEQIKSLQALVDEKDVVLREIRGNIGGDTEEARFEERSRILKDLVSSIAEFERYAANQPSQSREIEAVIKRFSSMLSSYKVTPTEVIGTQVAFNPQKHRLIEISEILPGEAAVIIERGFFIRDHKEKLRLLKPALVKKL